MNWTITESNFKYSGKPVTRKMAIINTPLGQFKVYEAVGGNCFIVHPFISKYNGGLPGYDDGTSDWFGPPKIQVKSFDEGIKRCQQKWEQVKDVVGKITL